jgi:hypothetical protein
MNVINNILGKKKFSKDKWSRNNKCDTCDEEEGEEYLKQEGSPYTTFACKKCAAWAKKHQKMYSVK